MAAAPEYQLYCFAQSGNAYRVALMLNLIGADWKPVWVDFFNGAVRVPEFRAGVNEMGEIPVLVHGDRKLSQSGVCLTWLAERSGKFLPEGEDERLECLRWILFDNQKVNGFLGPYRFLLNFAPARDPGGEAFLMGRLKNNLAIVDKRLAHTPWLAGSAHPTIADVSLAGYMFYPAEEFGFDIAKDYPAIGAWTERVKALPGWKHPYELMPGYPFGTKG
jgi:glutathione S-transferase